MNLNFIISISLVLISITAINAQDYKYKGHRAVLAKNIVSSLSNFYVYNPPLKVKRIYNDTIAAKNQYPEELMISILSSSSQEWEN